MIGCDTAVFTDPDDYRMSVPGVSIRLVLTGHGDFEARRTWVHIHRLSLVHVTETVPRVAFVRLAPGPVFVSFPTHYEPPPIWSGVAMRPGEIVFHGRGEPMHQRTHGATGWGLIALAPEDLAPYGPALARVGLAPPWTIRILQPPATVVAGLLRQHGDACRLAESTPDRVMNQKVARALERDMLDALVTCLTAGEGYGLTGARRHHADIMARFEHVLACHRPLEPLMPEVAAAVGASEATLRICCAEFVGMSPGQYARLRRLNLVRAALQRADPATASVSAIARQHGFSELGRFAGVYRTTFGEVPSVTLAAVRSHACDPASYRIGIARGAVLV